LQIWPTLKIPLKIIINGKSITKKEYPGT
jgi:hypothetical protein